LRLLRGRRLFIDSSGGWNAINIEASYIVVKGFTVVGDAADYTLQSALAGYSTGSSSLDGNGIGINPGSGASLPNHITIEDNTVYNEPGGGIYTEGADYVQILNNVVHNNANWSAFGNSGISVSTSANSDTQSGVHDIISGNLVYETLNWFRRTAPVESRTAKALSSTPIPITRAKFWLKTTRSTATAVPASNHSSRILRPSRETPCMETTHKTLRRRASPKSS
jgi:parallel beta-helix repeat protein